MITEIASTTHERVYQVSDTVTGLEGFIALHSTRLGPAAGGLRMRQYRDGQAALEDVLNLSRGMTYKNAAAGLPLGGGKAVIIGDPDHAKTPNLLRAMGRAIDALEGRYWTAEDMGMSPEDMAELARETQFVAGLDRGPHASGDPSPVTAQGVFNAMEIGAERVFGTPNLNGLRVAVQGLGHVGWHLCRMLHEAGAALRVADMAPARADEARRAFGAILTDTTDIALGETDIFAPCAIGGILDERTTSGIRARLVCGAANNQLATAEDAKRLHDRGVLYVPDYVANGGGIINVAAEIMKISDRAPWVAQKLETLRQTLLRILATAETSGVSPAFVADETVDKLILKHAS